MAKKNNYDDLIGTRVNELLIIGRFYPVYDKKHAWAMAICSCGNIATVRIDRILDGNDSRQKTCGHAANIQMPDDDIKKLNDHISKSLRNLWSDQKNQNTSKYFDEFDGEYLTELRKEAAVKLNVEIYRIHIDHKIPVSWWNYKTLEDMAYKLAWGKDNLQAILDIENLGKGNAYCEIDGMRITKAMVQNRHNLPEVMKRVEKYIPYWRKEITG